jgi:uncharacterized protein YggL (DUF469 family)
MTDTKQAWSQVADEFGGLGLKLKMHFEQAAEAHADDESVKKALDGLRDAVDRTGSGTIDGGVRSYDVEHSRS